MNEITAMTSIPHPLDFNMNLTAADDNMEMGTSPLRQPDDIDIEDLDPTHDRSVDNSMLDEAEFASLDADVMQADTEQFHEDDEMLDEGINDKFQQLVENDFRMNETGELDDEEILYDDDGPVPDEVVQDPQENTEVTAQSTDATSEIKYDDFDSTTAIDTYDDAGVTEGTITRTNETEQQVVDQAQHHEETSLSAETIEQREFVNKDTQQTTHVIDFAEEKESLQEAAEPQVHSDALDPSDGLITSSHADQSRSAINDSNDLATNQSAGSAKEVTLPEDEVSNGNVDQSRTDDADAHAMDTLEDLHPIKVLYLGEEMSMFPPLEEDATTTFFLQDASLAHESLDRLLSSCREVLGDSLGHEDELVLDIPALGLHICEDSKYASSLTLVQITEVYTKLCINEQTDSIDPLYCTLSSRVCLSTQYAYLFNAAGEGRSFSEIAADYVDTPEATNGTDEQPEDHETEAQVEAEAEALLASGGVENSESNDHEYSEQLNPEGMSKQQDIAAAENLVSEEISNHNTTYEHESFEESDVLQTTEIANANGSDEEKLTQENILTDIDNDLQSDLESDHLHSSTYTNAHKSVSQEHQGELNQSNEHTEVESIEDAASSHTLDAGYEEAEIEDRVEMSHPEGASAGEIRQIVGAAADNQTINHVEDGESRLPQDNNFEAEGDFVTDQPVQLSDKERSGDDLVEPLFGKDVPSQFDQTEHGTEDDIKHQNEAENSIGLELIDEDEASVPITPSKQVNSKRKAPEDEDDLDFLDLSTPEPKRRRPS